MRIEEEIKLDYSDVLFRPKRSTLKSRKDVDLNRKYTFKHSRSSWKGIPIIAIIGIPFHDDLECLKVYFLFKSTSFLLFKVLLFGLKRTSE